MLLRLLLLVVWLLSAICALFTSFTCLAGAAFASSTPSRDRPAITVPLQSRWLGKAVSWQSLLTGGPYVAVS
jgi:hypothetical protein